jgi:hypothetical protein
MIVTHDSRISLVSCIEGVISSPDVGHLIRVSLPVPHHAADLTTVTLSRQFFYERSAIVGEAPEINGRVLVITFRVTPKDEGSDRLPELRTYLVAPKVATETIHTLESIIYTYIDTQMWRIHPAHVNTQMQPLTVPATEMDRPARPAEGEPHVATRPGGPDLDNTAVTGDLPQTDPAAEDLGDR